MTQKTHRQYVHEQIEKSPEFAAEYNKARAETRFAIELARLREQRGLTQQQLAQAAGIGQPMLARYERGQMPTVPTLQRLAAALNARILLSPDDVVFQPRGRASRKRRAEEAPAA